MPQPDRIVFEEKIKTNLCLEQQIFKHCLMIYQIQKEIKKEGK